MEKVNERASSLKSQKRSTNFSVEDKRQLAREVQQWPRIWDLRNALHCDKNAVDQAWKQISGNLGKSVSECRAAWTSLRESYKYHARAAAKRKSGSAGGETLEEPAFSDSVDWEFAEDMAFLPKVSRKRRTFTSPDSEDETSTSNDSQYDYTTPLKKRRQPAAGSENAETWNKIDELLEKQQKMVKARQAAATELPFKGAFATFEWLLKQLPRLVADEACLEFTNSLLVKIQQHKASK